MKIDHLQAGSSGLAQSPFLQAGSPLELGQCVDILRPDRASMGGMGGLRRGLPHFSAPLHSLGSTAGQSPGRNRALADRVGFRHAVGEPDSIWIPRGGG